MTAGTVPTPSIAVGAAAVAALSAGTVIMFLLDGEINRSRNFMPLTEQLGVPVSGTNANTMYPSVKTATTVTDPTGASQVGQTKLVLTPGASDTINSSSVLSFVLDPNAIVGYVSSSTTF